MTVWVALEYDCFDGCSVAGVFTAEEAVKEFVERKEGERNALGAHLLAKDGYSPVSGYVYDGPCEVTE